MGCLLPIVLLSSLLTTGKVGNARVLQLRSRGGLETPITDGVAVEDIPHLVCLRVGIDVLSIACDADVAASRGY